MTLAIVCLLKHVERRMRLAKKMARQLAMNTIRGGYTYQGKPAMMQSISSRLGGSGSSLLSPRDRGTGGF